MTKCCDDCGKPFIDDEYLFATVYTQFVQTPSPVSYALSKDMDPVKLVCEDCYDQSYPENA